MSIVKVGVGKVGVSVCDHRDCCGCRRDDGCRASTEATESVLHALARDLVWLLGLSSGGRHVVGY
jgi:hypothetical protein